MDDSDVFQTSEFSIYEILYMGHAGLTYIVETTLDDAYSSDPFDAIALMEEKLGMPLAMFSTKEIPM
jgi:hypothetical protein